MVFGSRPNVGSAGFADVCTFLYRFSLLRFDDPGIRSMYKNNVFVHDWNAASGTIRLMESSKSPLQHTCMYSSTCYQLFITLQMLPKQERFFLFECHSSFIYTFLLFIGALQVGVLVHICVAGSLVSLNFCAEAKWALTPKLCMTMQLTTTTLLPYKTQFQGMACM